MTMIVEVPLWVAILYVVLLLLAFGLGTAQAAQLDRLRLRIRWQTEYNKNLIYNACVSHEPTDLGFYNFNNEE